MQETWQTSACLVLPLLLVRISPAAVGGYQSPVEIQAHVRGATVACHIERWAKYSTKNGQYTVNCTENLQESERQKSHVPSPGPQL